MSKVFIVIRSYDWGSYGQGSEIVKAFHDKKKAKEAVVELEKTTYVGSYGYNYEVEEVEIE